MPTMYEILQAPSNDKLIIRMKIEFPYKTVLPF